jgi:polar amino acid transport system substrate-binding protein
MPKMRRNRRTLIALLPVFLIVSACSNDDATPKAATDALPPAMATMSEELHALLPDDIREAGVIKTGGPVTEAPTLYLEEDATTRTGYMTDLANAVGDLLGVEIVHSEMPFPSLVPGLQRGSIDMTFIISDKKTRHEVLDFVDCLEDGLRILVPAGNPNGINSLESLCGHTVAVLSGSIAVGIVTEANKSCADPMEIKEFPGAAYAQLAVRSGQADATFGGGTALNYLSRTVGNGTVFEVAPGGPYTVQPDAFAFLKGNDELRDAVQAAVQRLVDNGTAAEIMEKYGVDPDGLYDPIPINVVE